METQSRAARIWVIFCLILAGEALPEQTVVVDVDGGEFTLSALQAERQASS